MTLAAQHNTIRTGMQTRRGNAGERQNKCDCASGRAIACDTECGYNECIMFNSILQPDSQIIMRLTVALLGLCITLAACYLLWSRKSKNGRDEPDQAFRKLVAFNLRSNIEQLKNGNLVWRRLGHGQSAVGLKKTAPHRGGVVPMSLESVAADHPDIIAKIREIDSRLDRLQATANRLASTLEEPVRKQFQDDRHRLADRDDESVRAFRRWLLQREDAWMEILANLVNNGHTLTKEIDPATLYWRHCAPSYHVILEQHGGAELKELERLRGELIDQSRELLNAVERENQKDKRA